MLADHKSQSGIRRRSVSGNALFGYLIEHREIPLLAVLALLALVVSIRVPGYLANNYMNILKGGSINMVMSTGMLCVLLIGSIDISVASTLALSGAISGMLMRDGAITSVFIMFIAGIGIGAAVGLVNGLFVSYGKVIPIIVTLGMSYIVRAFIPMGWLLGMNKIVRTDLTNGFKDFLTARYWLGLPYLVWCAVAATLIVGLFLRYTKVGRSLYAVGSNEEAASMRGVSINRVKLLAHTICGATAGLAGIMWLGYYSAIEKGSAAGQEMFTIAACVLGGVSVAGGYGKMVGVVVGAIMIALINSAIPQLGIGNSMITEFVKGILLLLAILLNVFLSRAANKRSLLRRGV
ncbi:ribose ABC transporter permease [Clostridia bacterium]|nr:ribose ABC transporter permease [Clostridia bacterium]